MASNPPACKVIQVWAFRGDRSRFFAAMIQAKLTNEKNGFGPGPTILECMLYSGHTGLSLDGGNTIFGFNPDWGNKAIWQLMDDLKNGDAFPGIVRDDLSVFQAAQNHPLPILSFEVILPDRRFQDFQKTLDAERVKSQYTYGFPNGDGDCNCITWLERMGLPLFTGRMDEFFGLQRIIGKPKRRFGFCR